jgi:beta-mannosidase
VGSQRLSNQTSNQATPFAPWSCCEQPAGVIAHPDQLPNAAPQWFPAIVPGTVASALQACGRWNLDQPLDADSRDWWYRTSFANPTQSGHACFLCFDGLAILSEIWVNGTSVLTTDNMFRAYRVDITSYLQEYNELTIAFRSLDHDLNLKRPRPRWKTKLVNQQQLRWRRASLLGRIPGWSPPVPGVGPWRAVRLESGPVCVSNLQLTTILQGDTGIVELNAGIDATLPIERATLCVGNVKAAVEVRTVDGGYRLRATIAVPNAPLWWPHTHGKQPLFEIALEIDAGGRVSQVDCGPVGFRKLEVHQDGAFAVNVNGQPIYCRGACWTISDITTLDGTQESLEHDLRLARDAGINMLRIGGTMIYESERFYQLCDALGIMVWQDFMFANMDYPVEDPTFASNIDAEVKYQLSRLSHPSVVVYCGGSEIEQQAAMLGVPREQWRNAWVAHSLPALCSYHPGSVYVPASPGGGAMPFHVGTGVTHYYGIGAYLRSIHELRKADVKFTSECLGFANIPEAKAIDAVGTGNPPVLHHPKWKQRTPRDVGTGWDFEDVRDFYLRQFFGVDPVQLRSFDPARYLQLSRVVTGEMMTQVFGEWRSSHSHNRGGLVWFYKDLWPGAGWGIIDSLGIPKAAFYYLRRSWQTRQITITDEGLDGLHIHVINETAEPLNAHVELMLLKDSHVVVARKEVPCQLAGRSCKTLESENLLDRFYDVTYAYRFGAPKHDVVIATLYDEQHGVLSEAYYFVQQRDPVLLPACNLEVRAEILEGGCFLVTMKSDRFLQSACFDVEGFLPDDNYFHLPPMREKKVRFTPLKNYPGPLKGYVEALNLSAPVKIARQAPG